jgi:hypothetical protein
MTPARCEPCGGCLLVLHRGAGAYCTQCKRVCKPPLLLDAGDHCPACEHKQERCHLCEDRARHFLDTDSALYLCDTHVEVLDPRIMDGETEWELGMYACCDGCICDQWR